LWRVLQGGQEDKAMERFMDAKYNRYLDSALVRFGVAAVMFSMWLGVGYGVLMLAA